LNNCNPYVPNKGKNAEKDRTDEEKVKSEFEAIPGNLNQLKLAGWVRVKIACIEFRTG
jgi:hypothetical protein